MALKDRALIKFPARVEAGTGLSVEKEAGVYTFELDLDAFSEATAIADQTATQVILYTDGVHERMDVDDFLTIASAATYEQTWKVLAHSAVAVSGAADTAKNDLATVTIPAGAMGANGRLRITTHWTVTDGADDKTISYEFGGTAFFSATVTTVDGIYDQRDIANVNDEEAQKSINAAHVAGFGSLSAAPTTGTVDTTAAVDLIFYGQKETGSDTITLESYTVELLYGE